MTRRIQLLLMTLMLLMAGAGSYLSLSAESLRPRLAARNSGSATAVQPTYTPPAIDVPSPPTPPIACCERPIGYPPRVQPLPTPAAGQWQIPYPYPEPYPQPHREPVR
jgi:hypothetical protein